MEMSEHALVQPMAMAEMNEVRQLEQDLENLERRYAMLVKLARWNKIFFQVLTVVVVGGVILFSVLGFIKGDYVQMILPLALLVIFVGTVKFCEPEWPFPHRRWLEWAGWFPPGTYGFKYWGLPSWDSIKRSEAEAIEQMIEDRKERLAALRGKGS